DVLIDIAPDINHAAVGKDAPIESPASPTISANRQTGHQHLQTTKPYAIVHGEQKNSFTDRPSPWRHKFPRRSSIKATESQSLAWAAVPPEVSVSKSDIRGVANPYSARIRTAQPEIVARKPPETIYESL